MRKHLSCSALYQQTKQTYIITEGKHLYPFARFQVSIQLFNLTKETVFVTLPVFAAGCTTIEQLVAAVAGSLHRRHRHFCKRIVKLCKANQKQRPIYLKAKVGPFEGLNVGSTTLTLNVNILLFHFESPFLNFHYSSEIKWQVGDKLQSTNYLLAVKAGTRRFLVCSVAPRDRQQPLATIRQHE